jgi:hypothetical protein
MNWVSGKSLIQGDTIMLQPENQNKKYDFLFADIDSGRIKIPKFQRDFVWTKDQTAKLIDSIIKGYPIGTFIFWKTNEELRHMKNIGNVELPNPPAGEPVNYVLDGQQRITSLYSVRKGIVFNREGQEIDYKDISINLELDPDEDEQVVFTIPPEGARCISLHKLLNGTLTELLSEYEVEHLKKIEVYQKRLTGYDFSTIMISQYPLDIACDIFTRINTAGTELTLFEIMVAKTYDAAKGFDLSEKYDDLINGVGKDKGLVDADFDTVPTSTVLQCVSAYLNKQIRRKDILKIQRSQFIDIWPIVVDGIFVATDYLRKHLRIPVSQLLPYDALLIPLTYFFIRNYRKPPTPEQDRLLSQYFWWASIGMRYSSGMENKVAQDLERMDLILNGEIPSYRGEEIELTLDHLKWRWFSPGDAYCKAILCLLSYHLPRSFNDDSPVTLDNTWLKTSTSKNYHHFFPRSYLKNKGIPDWQANTIMNITIVDDHLNKNKIKAKPPSEYMLDFLDSNPKLEDTMRSHLIDDLDNYGVWDDDYQKFIEERGKRVIEELSRRLNFKK